MNNILKCCICGFENKDSILSHIRNVHAISSKEYRKKFNMPLRSAWILRSKKNIEEFKKIGHKNSILLLNKPGRAKLKENQWSRNGYVCCKQCGSNKNKHQSHGLCVKCSANYNGRQKTERQNKKLICNSIENKDYVVCKICNKPFRVLLSYGHLKLHNLTEKEYKIQFNNAVTRPTAYQEKISISISKGRKNLMLTRGFLNPPSQRIQKSKEMSKRHSTKSFSKISKIEKIVEEWFVKNEYNILCNSDINKNNINFKTIIKQYLFEDKYCVDFACPERKIVIEVLGDWWHGWLCLSGKESYEKLYPKVKKNLYLDNKRFKDIIKKQWTLIKIWEHDIKNENFVNILKQYFKN